MNVFDIILYIALAWAVFNGWRRGLLLQLLSLVAVVAAFYLSVKYGAATGRALGMDEGAAAVAGFIIVFLAALVAVGVAGHLMRAVFRFAGLGAADVVLGVAFSVAKILLVMSVLYSWFGALNADYRWASRQTVEESRWLGPVSGLAERLTPYFDELKNRIDD